MVATQLDKLQYDSAQLKRYADALHSQGKQKLSEKVLAKRDYLNAYIRQASEHFAT